jgi:hypothetical protein
MDVVAAHARVELHLAQMSTSEAATSGAAHEQLAATLAYVGLDRRGPRPADGASGGRPQLWTCPRQAVR